MVKKVYSSLMAIFIVMQSMPGFALSFAGTVYQPSSSVLPSVTSQALTTSPPAFPGAFRSLGYLTILYFEGLTALYSAMSSGSANRSGSTALWVSVGIFSVPPVLSWWSRKASPPSRSGESATPPRLPEEEELKQWLRKTFPEQAERLINNYKLADYRSLRGNFEKSPENKAKIILRFGPEVWMELHRVDVVFDFLRVLRIMEKLDYPIPNPLSKGFLLLGIDIIDQEEYIKPTATNEQTGEPEYNFISPQLKTVVENSPLFTDDPAPIPKSFTTALPRLLEVLLEAENRLSFALNYRITSLMRIKKNRPDDPANLIAAQAMKSEAENEKEFEARIRRFDKGIRSIRAAYREVQLPERSHAERPPFPQHLSTVEIPPDITDPALIEAGEFLLHLMTSPSSRNLSRAPHLGLLMVGTDFSQAGVGGAVRYNRYQPPPSVAIASGGKEGGLKRPEFKTEAEFLEAVIKVSGLPIPEQNLHLESASGGVIDHVKKSLDLIERENLKVEDGLLVSQSPMQQLRTVLILQYELKKRGLFIPVQNIPPFFRNMKLAPDRWDSLGEWQRRILFDGPREIYMILGAQDPKIDAIDPEFKFDPLYLQAAIVAGRHILTDATVPEDKKAEMQLYLARIEAQLVFDTTDDGVLHSSPISLVLPSYLKWTVSVIAYPGRMIQEFFHKVGLYLSGVPWSQIDIDGNILHPETRVRGDHSASVLPSTALGWLSNWMVMAAIAAVLPVLDPTATLWLPVLLLKALWLSNGVEALMNAIPHRVWNNGRLYQSDMQVLISAAA